MMRRHVQRFLEKMRDGRDTPPRKEELQASQGTPAEDTDYEADAQRTAEILINSFNPDTVFHIGCGIGRHLKPFHDRGIDVQGVDASTVAHENAIIPTEHITIADLTEAHATAGEYDLVMCLDILAHTPEDFEDEVVNAITAAGNTAVISPVTTEQVIFNDEPEEYWINKFESAGMTYCDEETRNLRQQIKDHEIQWAPANPLVFRRAE